MTQISVCQSQSKLHSVQPPLYAGGLSLQPNVKKGDFTEPQLLEGFAGKERVTYFRQGGGGCNCHVIN